MRLRLTFIVALLMQMVAMVQPAAAVKQFYDVFVTENLDNRSDPKFAEFVKNDVKCLVCHQGLKSKKHRNAYGQELAKLLTKKDAKDKEKIIAALKTVADMHVNPADDKSETFGARIAAGKLPGGELDELKKEPADDGEDEAK